jgi:hypothetical protein
MNSVSEFAAFDAKKYAAATRRVYVNAAKKALKILGKTPENCGSYEELLALLHENRAQKKFPKSATNRSLLELFGFKNP